VPDVDGIDAGREALKQAIGEPAGRGSNVEADEAGRIQSEVIESRGELHAAAGDERMRRLPDGDRRLLGDGLPRLLRAAAIDFHASREDQGLRPLARRGQAALDEGHVQPPRGLASSAGPHPNVMATFMAPSGSRALAKASRA
jgi:hypothetical protein